MRSTHGTGVAPSGWGWPPPRPPGACASNTDRPGSRPAGKNWRPRAWKQASLHTAVYMARGSRMLRLDRTAAQPSASVQHRTELERRGCPLGRDRPPPLDAPLGPYPRLGQGTEHRLQAHQRPREEGERIENGPQQIRIVFSGMTGFIPTALVALSLDDTELLCDHLNARLGLDRKAWSALVRRSMAAGYNGARAH